MIRCHLCGLSFSPLEFRLHDCARTSLPRIGRITIKAPNQGYSLGLQYGFVYGKIHDRWLVWYCGSGVVVYVVPISRLDGLDESTAMNKCYELNGLSKYPDAATLDAIDATP